MDKELKQKLNNSSIFPSLYDIEWVEETADKGYNKVIDALKDSIPGFDPDDHRFSSLVSIIKITYYSSFEDALRQFKLKCLTDGVDNITNAFREFNEKVEGMLSEKKH